MCQVGGCTMTATARVTAMLASGVVEQFDVCPDHNLYADDPFCDVTPFASQADGPAVNVRYDTDVHAVGDGSSPLCGSAFIPAYEPEPTSDAVTCWECKSLV